MTKRTMYDPKYGIRHRVRPVTALSYYKRPIPMVGDPFGVASTTWAWRSQVLYREAMDKKRGIVRVPKRGLWYWI